MSIASMISLSSSRLKQRRHVTAVAASADVHGKKPVAKPSPKTEIQGVPSSTVEKVTAFPDYAALLSLPSLAVDAFGSTISTVLPFRVAVALDGSTSADRSCTRKICCERTSE